MLQDPPDGQPPTCVGAPEVGHVFRCAHHASVPALSGNADHEPRRVDQKCEHCDQPGVNFFDREWCCDACGQDVLDRLTEESMRPAPKPDEKPKSIRPGQRGRRKK